MNLFDQTFVAAWLPYAVCLVPAHWDNPDYEMGATEIGTGTPSAFYGSLIY